jgi:hypothetical protein
MRARSLSEERADGGIQAVVAHDPEDSAEIAELRRHRRPEGEPSVVATFAARPRFTAARPGRPLGVSRPISASKRTGRD